jgi:hypothetical protein
LRALYSVAIRRPEVELERYLGAVNVEITEEDRERLNKAAPPGRATVAYFEADFGPNRFRW